MVLRATWQRSGGDRAEEYRFKTPLGNGVGWLREFAGKGDLLLRVDGVPGSRYIEPRKHSAFGALAFFPVPEISGTSARLRLTAIPQEWLDFSTKVAAVLGGAGLQATFENRTLELRGDNLSPAALLRLARPTLFALDSFSRGRVSEAEFTAVRRSAAKLFRDRGEELLSLLDPVTGEGRLRQLFSARSGSKQRLTRIDAIAAYLERLDVKDIVQFNCASGQLLQGLIRSGHFASVAGVEPSEKLCDRARLRLGAAAEIFEGSLLEPPRGLNAEAAGLLVDSLPAPLDSRLERVAEVLLGDIGFELVICIESARGRWSSLQLGKWAATVKDRYSYEVSPSNLGSDAALVLRRGQKSPERRRVSTLWEPEIITKAGPKVRIELPQWQGTSEAFSKWTVDPRWLIYLPAGLCSLQSKEVSGPLEHPRAAFEYYRAEGISKIVVQFKHMGSRAIVVVCRDENAGQKRFGIPSLGTIYTRNGRPFWEDPMPALSSIRDGLNRAKLWERFKTDWICLDGELLPWTLKAEDLIEGSHGELLRCGEALIEELRTARGGSSPKDIPNLDETRECYRRYRVLYERYQAEAEKPFHFAPFHLIATEGRSYFNQNHNWHMEVFQSIVRGAGAPFFGTQYRTFSLDDECAVEECCRWWEEVSASGAEGVVVKPLYFVPKGRRGLAQPGIKCRGVEHLRMVYGPEYDLLENRWALASREALKRRREKHRRVVKQLALSVEGVDRFVQGESVDRIQACVRGVLGLEREPQRNPVS